MSPEEEREEGQEEQEAPEEQVEQEGQEDLARMDSGFPSGFRERQGREGLREGHHEAPEEPR